jgi:hypothetical protein
MEIPANIGHVCATNRNTTVSTSTARFTGVTGSFMALNWEGDVQGDVAFRSGDPNRTLIGQTRPCGLKRPQRAGTAIRNLREFSDFLLEGDVQGDVGLALSVPVRTSAWGDTTRWKAV